MNILITGSNGLIGSALFASFEQAGHAVYRVSRNPGPSSSFYCNHRAGDIRTDDGICVDVVINLAGESSQGRWTGNKKQEMFESRVRTTRLISQKIAGMKRKPSLLISASAVGYYGDTGDREVSEKDAPGDGFLADLSRKWEAETLIAKDAGIRTVNARFGVVLSPAGGALKQILVPFRLGLGGRIGSGRQHWSWIGLTELVSMMDFIMKHESIDGPVNLVSRSSVTNAELTRALAEVLSRPAFMHMPAFIVRAAFGEMADAMLLPSCRAVPAKLLEHGYRFLYEDIETALRAQLGTG